MKWYLIVVLICIFTCSFLQQKFILSLQGSSPGLNLQGSRTACPTPSLPVIYLRVWWGKRWCKCKLVFGPIGISGLVAGVWCYENCGGDQAYRFSLSSLVLTSGPKGVNSKHLPGKLQNKASHWEMSIHLLILLLQIGKGHALFAFIVRVPGFFGAGMEPCRLKWSMYFQGKKVEGKLFPVKLLHVQPWQWWGAVKGVITPPPGVCRRRLTLQNTAT